jgi:hypothetical protein
MTEEKITKLQLFKSVLKLAEPVGIGLAGAGIVAAGVMTLWGEGALFSLIQGKYSSYMPVKEALEYATGSSILFGVISGSVGFCSYYEELAEAHETVKKGFKQLIKKR